MKKEITSQQLFECIQIKRLHPRTKYLVLVREHEAISKDVLGHAMCSVIATSKGIVLHCENVKCRRGKNKHVKNIKSFSDLCCHLRTLQRSHDFMLSDNEFIVHMESDPDEDIIDGSTDLGMDTHCLIVF